ncbi:haloacid dehalogenase [Bryobacterales bacterium F-183]|nr:haloacid dehalogenase [Bryobacterales bacterium F-183]
MSEPVQAVILDYGGVICKLPEAEQTRQLAELCGLSTEDFLTYFWQYRLAYDRADLDDRSYWHSIASSAGKSYSDEQIARFDECDVRFWLTLDEPMLEWNRTLRAAGFKTAILSNMPASLGMHIRKHTDLFDQFDVVTLSYEVRSAKPEPEIYKSCLADLGLRGEQTLFFDDKLTNIRAAQALGIHAITYKSRAELNGQETAYGLPAVPLHG